MSLWGVITGEDRKNASAEQLKKEALAEAERIRKEKEAADKAKALMIRSSH